MQDTNNRLGRLYDAIETGKISLDELSPRIRAERYKQDKLQARQIELVSLISERRLELADIKTVTAYVADLHNLLSESSLIEKKILLRSFIKEIKVTGKDVLLTYTLPVLPDGASG